MIYLALGSNVGNKIANLFGALELLSQNFKITKKSIIIKTKAISHPDTPAHDTSDYFNMVLEGDSSLTPQDFLVFIKNIEYQMGRDPHASRWSARIIDIDILLWHSLQVHSADLIIPHTQIIKRDFILHLLSTLDPDLSLSLPLEDFVYEDVDASIVHNSEMMVKLEDDNNAVLQEEQIDIFNDLSCALPDEASSVFASKAQEGAGQVLPQVSISNLAHHRAAEQSLLEGSMTAHVKLVGILNLTNDSFSHDVIEDADECLAKMLHMQEYGAYIIDVGGQATNPRVKELDMHREEEVVRAFFNALSRYNKKHHQHYKVSLDSFTSHIIDYALTTNLVAWINDVTGNLSEDLANKIYDSPGVKLLTMHSVTVPPNKHSIISGNVLHEMQSWIYKTVQKFSKLALSKRLILDPGIGFGKSIYQNLELLRIVQKLDCCGCELLVGHSRKSFLLASNPIDDPRERDFATIAISSALSSLNIDYLRVHDIVGHQKFLATQGLMRFS